MALKKVFFCIFFTFLVLSLTVYSATQAISVVDKSKEQQPEKSFWRYFKAWWVYLILILLVLALILWLVIWLAKKIKEGKDIWYKIWMDKKSLCKLHRDKWRIHAFFGFRKNCPIKVYYVNNEHTHTKTVGYYKGHYTSRDGNLTLMFNCRRKWLVFPKTDFLFLNSKEKIKILKKKKVMDGKIEKMILEEMEIKVPKISCTFDHEEILIGAYGIDFDYRTEFFVPVIKDEKGNVVNMFLPLYQGMKEIAIEGYLYDQTDDFVRVNKKAIDLNPTIRGMNKINDNSSSVDTQEGTMR